MLTHTCAHACTHKRSDKPSLMRSVISLSCRATMCKIREVISHYYFISISISNYFIKFHYYSGKHYERKLHVIKSIKCKLHNYSVSNLTSLNVHLIIRINFWHMYIGPSWLEMRPKPCSWTMDNLLWDTCTSITDMSSICFRDC